MLDSFFWLIQILTNFLSSVMIHATRPFVINEWIQTTIEGYEVSGTVEVCAFCPSIITFRREYREYTTKVYSAYACMSFILIYSDFYKMLVGWILSDHTIFNTTFVILLVHDVVSACGLVVTNNHKRR